ncbi:Dynein heavy chain 10, axonemal [Cichlidogyrus casuarinus]|uniref:Dynein heavy chain 10, axonemal n=1 Tax=Cichlidogyrus casuarinus TaxID=1844966 RepID=A0ABD2QDV6_9PLAT
MYLDQQENEEIDEIDETPKEERQTIRVEIEKDKLYLINSNKLKDIYDVELFIYFTRSSLGVVPLIKNEIPMHIQMGILYGNPLQELQTHLNYLIYPMLTFKQLQDSGRLTIYLNQISTDDEKNKEALTLTKNIQAKYPEREFSKKSSFMARDEFLVAFRKFSRSVDSIFIKLEGTIHLEIPQINLDMDAKDILNDKHSLQMVLDCVTDWNSTIDDLMLNVSHMSPKGEDPLAEIDYWKDVDCHLNGIFEQLRRPNVKHMYHLYSLVNEGFAMDSHFQELYRLQIEAKENVRFLTLIERHCKTLTFGTTFAAAIETLFPLVQALQMIWVISRHYNKDERMVPLMERIAWALRKRVRSAIDIPILFNNPLSDVKIITKEAQTLLETWKTVYMARRAEIEASGRDNRWEFDRKRLFEKTDYMARVCNDLYEIEEVITQFKIIFGSELKSVTSEAKRIAEVERMVDLLVVRFETIHFNPFIIDNRTQWEETLEEFYKDVTKIENEAENFINNAFKSLRSAESAFDLLLKFQNIKSRECIHRLLTQKYIDILDQYEKELLVVQRLFEGGSTEPPNQYQPTRARFEPMIAGSIQWERHLFNCIKRPIVRFIRMEEMMQTDRGKQIRNDYLILGRRMKAYEDQLHQVWWNKTENSLPVMLSRCLFKQVPDQELEEKIKMFWSIIAVSDKGPDEDWMKRVKVDFDTDIFSIVAETNIMEILGFKVPQLAKSIALHVIFCFNFVSILVLSQKNIQC